MGKFQNLEDYLKREKTEGKNEFSLSLSEIEKILGFELAPTARKYSAYWNTSSGNSISQAVLSAGYEMKSDLKNGTVTFSLATTEVENGGKKKKGEKKAKQSKKKVNNDVPKPSKEEVKYWLDEWKKLPDYTTQEEAISDLFKQYKLNNDLKQIIVKCSVLNDFYSTNIFKVYPVACHILKLNVDERIKKGDDTIVNEIAKITLKDKTTLEDKEHNFYSFASKYCSHHNKEEYPIYDYYVEKMLIHCRKLYNFNDFKDKDLKDYAKFKSILVGFQVFFDLEEYTLKELDRYLWQAGKKYYPKKYKKK